MIHVRIDTEIADGVTLYGGNSTGPIGLGTAEQLKTGDSVNATLTPRQALGLIRDVAESFDLELLADETLGEPEPKTWTWVWLTPDGPELGGLYANEDEALDALYREWAADCDPNTREDFDAEYAESPDLWITRIGS